MNYQVISKQDNCIRRWAGGETAEIFISPPYASYEERNFTLRVSSATIELEGSPYSDFSGFVRHITPLRGEMHIIHEGHHSARLKPYQVDTFEGSWPTRSYGACIDFNLIHTPDWMGGLAGMKCPGVVGCEISGLTGFFARCDALMLEITAGPDLFREELHCGDFLVVETDGEECSVRLSAPGEPEALAVIVRAGRRPREN